MNFRLTYRQRWWIHLVLVSAYCLQFGISGLLARHTSLAPSAHPHPVAGLLYRSGRQMLLFGFLFGLAFYCSRVTPRELLLRWRGRIKPLWQGIGYSIAFRFIVGCLITIAFTALILAGVLAPYQIRDIATAQSSGFERIVSASAMRSDPVYFWLSLTWISFILAGLCEELWRSAFLAAVKALWPRAFHSWLGKLGAVLVAAMIFGFGHTTQSPMAVLHACLMGICLGTIMLVHRSIWPAVIAHGCFDATSMLIIALRHAST